MGIYVYFDNLETIVMILASTILFKITGQFILIVVSIREIWFIITHSKRIQVHKSMEQKQLFLTMYFRIVRFGLIISGTNVTVFNNTIDTGDFGLSVYGKNCSITKNTVTHFNTGISSSSSYHNDFISNNISYNQIGIQALTITLHTPTIT